MKQMEYKTERCLEVLVNGVYLGHKFAILSLGTHPVAYVENKIPDLEGYDDERLDSIAVHFGFTYYGENYWAKKTDDNIKYLGWDYAHFRDYCGFMSEKEFSFFHLKKWTTAEIFKEVTAVIDQLVTLEKKVLKNE